VSVDADELFVGVEARYFKGFFLYYFLELLMVSESVQTESGELFC